MQDDARGVGQGVRDNKVTDLEFVLQVEPRSQGAPAEEPAVMNPTLLGHHINEMLNHPLVALIGQAGVTPRAAFAPLTAELPCDVFLSNVRTLAADSSDVAFWLHRKGFVCGYEAPEMTCTRASGPLDLRQIFSAVSLSGITEHTLTLMHPVASPVASTGLAQLNPNEIYAFKATVGPLAKEA